MQRLGIRSSFIQAAFISTALSFIPFFGLSQVWQETFNGLANGTTVDNGATKWTTTAPPGAAIFSKQTPAAGYELFMINDTGPTEGVWSSEVVNISAATEIAVEVTLYSYFTFSTDYVRCYYKLNSGPEIQFGELLGSNGLQIASAASAIVSGSTLQVIIRTRETTAGTNSGYPRALGFDDVSMSSLRILYSRQTGNWTDPNTWSITGFGGATCSCTPDEDSRVIIGNARTVTINAAANTAGINVQNTGILRYGSNYVLTMERGGTINISAGGIISMNTYTGSSILYGAYAYSVVVNGTLSTGVINASPGSNISFSGNGSVVLGDDFRISSGSGRTITLDVGGFTVTDQLNFITANTALINKRTLTAGSMVVNAGINGNQFTNVSTGIINIGAITLNNGDFTLDNNGTITQTGNFNTVDAGSFFNNLNSSTWNFSGGGTNGRLFCNVGTNLFNYNAAGAQTLFVPTGGYSNLTLSGSGLKTLGGALDVNGNLIITGTAQLDVSATPFAVTLAGNWSVTSSNTDPFVQRTGSVTFDGTLAQLISTAPLGTESFYNLIINKASLNAQLSASDVVVANILTLTAGGLDLIGRTLTISNGATTAIGRTSGFIKSESTTAPYGQVRWTIGTTPGSHIFPFGKTSAAADYIPFTFNITTAGAPAAGSVSVMTYATPANNMPYPTGVSNVNNAAGVDKSASVADRFWFITLNSYITNPIATVTFVATSGEVGTISALKAQRWNSVSSKWDVPLASQTNPTLYSVTVPAVNTFSPWALSGNNVILPIDLLYFKASLNIDEVEIDWSSAQELNSSFYTVEKTTDFEHFQEVGRLEGAGTTKESHVYHAVDTNPIVGKSYYRLKQTDFDGAVTYFKPVMIDYDGLQQKKLEVYPVPGNGSELTIEIKGVAPNERFHLIILNMQGQQVYEHYVAGNDGGKIVQKLFFANRLQSGVYLVKVGSFLSLNKRIVVE